MTTVAVMTKTRIAAETRRDRIVDVTWTTIDRTMMMSSSTRRGENERPSGIIIVPPRREINTRVTLVRGEAPANETETEREIGIEIVIVAEIEVGIVMEKARRHRHRRLRREEIDLKTDHIISLIIYFYFLFN